MPEPTQSIQVHIPDAWSREIAAGTAFGKRVELAIKTMKPPSITVTSTSVRSVVCDVGAGTAILAAIEAATAAIVECDDCRKYLLSLDASMQHDVEDIITALLDIATVSASPLIPPPTQQNLQEWLRCIVEATLLEWVDSPETSPAPTPAPAKTLPLTKIKFTSHVFKNPPKKRNLRHD